MEPTTYYVDSTIRITSEGIFLRDRVYTLDAVSAVEVKAFRINRALLRALPLALLFVFFISFHLVTWDFSGGDVAWLQWMDNLLNLFTVFLALYSLAMVSFYVYLFVTMPRGQLYSVRLHGTFDQTTIFVATEIANAKLVADKIHEAQSNWGDLGNAQSSLPGQYTKQHFSNDDRIVIRAESVSIGDKVYALDDIKSAQHGLVQIDPIADRLDAFSHVGFYTIVGSSMVKRIVEDPNRSVVMWLDFLERV